MSALRSLILAAADSPRLQRFVQRYGFRLGAARFVAGETLDDAVPVLRRLNDDGLLTNTTLLGEGVRDEAETRAVVAAYTEVLDRIHTEGLRTNLAVKLTHLGLSIDEELARRNVSELVEHAASVGNFLRMDMEESRTVDATLRIYRRLREEGHANVGTVLQAYLFRAEDDLAALLPLAPNLRIVKGAYLEPPEIAYPQKRDVDAAYARLVEASLEGGGFTAVATHDETLIEHAIATTTVTSRAVERSAARPAPRGRSPAASSATETTSASGRARGRAGRRRRSRGRRARAGRRGRAR